MVQGLKEVAALQAVPASDAVEVETVHVQSAGQNSAEEGNVFEIALARVKARKQGGVQEKPQLALQVEKFIEKPVSPAQIVVKYVYENGAAIVEKVKERFSAQQNPTVHSHAILEFIGNEIIGPGINVEIVLGHTGSLGNERVGSRSQLAALCQTTLKDFFVALLKNLALTGVVPASRADEHFWTVRDASDAGGGIYRLGKLSESAEVQIPAFLRVLDGIIHFEKEKMPLAHFLALLQHHTSMCSCDQAHRKRLFERIGSYLCLGLVDGWVGVGDVNTADPAAIQALLDEYIGKIIHGEAYRQNDRTQGLKSVLPDISKLDGVKRQLAIFQVMVGIKRGIYNVSYDSLDAEGRFIFEFDDAMLARETINKLGNFEGSKWWIEKIWPFNRMDNFFAVWRLGKLIKPGIEALYEALSFAGRIYLAGRKFAERFEGKEKEMGEVMMEVARIYGERIADMAVAMEMELELGADNFRGLNQERIYGLLDVPTRDELYAQLEENALALQNALRAVEEIRNLKG